MSDDFSIPDAFWADYFGCSGSALFAEPFRILKHGEALADYRGVFALFREGCAMVSIPANGADAIEALLTEHAGCGSPEGLATALGTVAEAIVGPAFIGYADVDAGGEAVQARSHSARVVDRRDALAVEALRGRCDATEWEHGGSALEDAASGVFVGERLVALAGYEVWGGAIAHISIVTDPGFRGRGFGRSAVAHLASRAKAAGLLPQYRTLEANEASLRIARALGFRRYAISLAARLKERTRV